MKIKITLSGLSPITLNHSHKITTRGKFVKKYKTPEYVKFESIIGSKLRLYKSDINKLNKFFDEKIHKIEMDYKFFMPVLKKNGIISKTSKDVDNCIKTTQDSLFKSFLFDDAFITKVTAEKIHSENSYIELVVNILTR